MEIASALGNTDDSYRELSAVPCPPAGWVVPVAGVNVELLLLILLLPGLPLVIAALFNEDSLPATDPEFRLDALLFLLPVFAGVVPTNAVVTRLQPLDIVEPLINSVVLVVAEALLLLLLLLFFLLLLLLLLPLFFVVDAGFVVLSGEHLHTDSWTER